MSFLSNDELKALGFKSLGKNVMISVKASIHNHANISIGSNTRIDDFCILSAGQFGIEIGNHVHIACFCSLIGKERIVIEDFAGLSARCAIYSSSDDYSGEFMTNPTVSDKFTNIYHAPVTLQRHVILGAGTVILPGVTLGTGAAVGALSLVTEDLMPFSINMGAPTIKIKNRKRNFLEFEREFLNKELSCSTT